MDHEAIELFEASRIEQRFHPFSGGELSSSVLSFDTGFPACLLGAAVPLCQFFQ
jgi:hypothetical protein